MRKNLLKEKLLNKQKVVGCGITVCAPMLIEVLAMSGVDYVIIDYEHSALNLSDCEHLIRVAENANITPIVRVPMNEPQLMIRYLDSGAQGILTPGVANKAEAEKAAEAVRYYPRGMRGLGASRASGYGIGMPLNEFCEYANSQMLLILSMENIECVSNIEDILSVDGVDGLWFGANDLSQSLGVPGQTRHPLVREALEKARQACLKSGKPFGGVVRKGESPLDYYQQGYLSVLISVPSLLSSAAKDFVKLAKG